MSRGKEFCDAPLMSEMPLAPALEFEYRSLMKTPTQPLGMTEFVLLLAFMISILALSIDAMLPALGLIGEELGVRDPNHTQLVITSMFLGFAFGQIIAGPLSDCYGRRPVIIAGYGLFILGCLFCMLTQSFQVMMVGRVMQGLGAAAPRIVGVALVRDGYEGRAMARIMSIVMAFFILVPAIAPAIGQGMIWLDGWRSIFAMLLSVALIALLWFSLRQPETLAIDQRRVFSFTALWGGICEAFSYRALVGYTIAAGMVFGAFLGYLSSAQQIFQDIYQTGEMFSLWFGSAALAIGAASVYNSKVVMRVGMRVMTRSALYGVTTVSVLFLGVVLVCDGVPPFFLFMIWLLITFFGLGILFGNLNAMAMEPVGHMAGLGAAIVGAFSTFVSLPLGWLVGAEFNGTVLPLVTGFASLSALSILIMVWTNRV